MPSDVRRAALIGFTLAATLMTLSWVTTDDPNPAGDSRFSFAEVFEQPRNRAEIMVNRGEGPAAAQLATDPTLAHPEEFHDYYAESSPETELAYRAARPALPALLWVASLGGRRDFLAPALFAITCASLAAASAAAAAVATRLGRQAAPAAFVVMLPGLAFSMWAPGGVEPMASALVLAGWVTALSDGSARRQNALFSLAVLTRESMIILPLALAITSSAWTTQRRLLTAVTPALTYGLIAALIWARTGSPPGNAGGRRSAPLFEGLIDVAPALPVAGWVLLAMLMGLGVSCWRLGGPESKAVVILHFVLAAGLGPAVWERPLAVARVFSLIQIIGLLAALPPRDTSTPGEPVEVE